MTTERQALIRYRVERAWETLAEAEGLAALGRWNGCVNRLYDACFYAVNAWLLQMGLSSPKHSGVRGLFNQHCVKTCLISAELGALFNTLFNRRQQGDYEDLVRFSEAQVRPWLEQAPRFVARITEILDVPGPGASDA